jgi:hypothetical protein
MISSEENLNESNNLKLNYLFIGAVPMMIPTTDNKQLSTNNGESKLN